MGLLAEITEPFYDVEDSRTVVKQPDVFPAIGLDSLDHLRDVEAGCRCPTPTGSSSL